MGEVKQGFENGAPTGIPPIAIRAGRVGTTISLHEPDRVPFIPCMNNFYAYHYNMVTVKEWMTDPTCMFPVIQRYLQDYDPDVVWSPIYFPIKAMEAAGSNFNRWPGEYWNLPDNTPYQYIDHAFMDADDYDEFFRDPTLFILNKVLPQKYKNFPGLALLNPYGLCNQCILSATQLGLPPVQETLQNMIKTGQEVMDYMGKGIGLEMSVVEAGYPVFGSTTVCCAFDDFADHVRGLMDLCMDVITDPEKVDRALELWGDVTYPAAIAQAKMAHAQYVFIPLHCGVDNFMSLENYEKHYWPCLKRLIDMLIAADLTPFVMCEGKYFTRLDCISDVEPGKVLYFIEQTDWKEAKEKVGKVAAIAGAMDTNTLMLKKPEDVEDEVKRMFDILAPGGGFVSANSVALDYVTPENMHAWRNAVEKYGTYK